MKRILLTAIIAFTTITVYSQKQDSSIITTTAPIPVSLDSIQSYIGKLVKVKGKVYGVKETGKVAFINVGAAFPNAILTLFIPFENLSNFKDVTLSGYDGKEITVYGKVDLYRNKPQIVLQFPEQVIIKEQ